MFDKRTGKVVTDILVETGVNHIYGMPGDSINELIDDLKREETIDFIQVRHEETAALAAASYAKLTGNIGVCLSIAGPGAIHLLNGLYDAKMDRAPVLAIIGQVSSELVGTGAFQEVHLTRIFEDVAVYCEKAQTEAQLPDLLNQALKTAYEEKGVAVLIVPDDLFANPYKNNSPLTSSLMPDLKVKTDTKDILIASEKINQAKKPVILAGKGSLKAKIELQKFAERIQAPVIVSLPGKGAISDYHPLCMGNIGQLGTKPSYDAMQDTDLLILVGTSFPYREFLPKNAEAIQIDLSPSKIGKYYPVTHGIVGDTQETLTELIREINEKEESSFSKKYKKARVEWLEEIERDCEYTGGPIKPQTLIHELQKVTEDDAILSVDVGTITVWAARVFQMTKQTLLTSSWLATMGCGSARSHRSEDCCS